VFVPRHRAASLISKSGLHRFPREQGVYKSGKYRAIAETRRPLAQFSFHFTLARGHGIAGRQQEDFGPDLTFCMGLCV
jgi:hypothetical protein